MVEFKAEDRRGEGALSLSIDTPLPNSYQNISIAAPVNVFLFYIFILVKSVLWSAVILTWLDMSSILYYTDIWCQVFYRTITLCTVQPSFLYVTKHFLSLYSFNSPFKLFIFRMHGVFLMCVGELSCSMCDFIAHNALSKFIKNISTNLAVIDC